MRRRGRNLGHRHRTLHGLRVTGIGIGTPDIGRGMPGNPLRLRRNLRSDWILNRCVIRFYLPRANLI